MKIKSFGKVSLDTLVGEVLKIGERDIYPVIEVKTLRENSKRLYGVWVSPLAIVVVESSNKYVISLTSETFSLEQILEKVPSLRKMLIER